ncbi:MAG: hypothetical protein NTX25_18880 [Proteobacteria bacterium]|nr:hypothetical protein [Pseudomonadota bacterium]
MNALIILIIIVAALAAPSGDHVRSDIELNDRGNIICEGGVSDGRKTILDSSYTSDADQDYGSAEAIVTCHAKILGDMKRSMSDDILLNRLDGFADKVAVKLKRYSGYQEAIWTISVYYDDVALQAKILNILKTRLTEAHIALRQQVPLKQLIDEPVKSMPATCQQQKFTDRSRAHLYVIQVESPASALRAAICTKEGWLWL